MPDIKSALTTALASNPNGLKVKGLPERIWLCLQDKPRQRSIQLAATLKEPIKNIQRKLVEMHYRRLVCQVGEQLQPGNGKRQVIWDVHPESKKTGWHWGPAIDRPEYQRAKKRAEALSAPATTPEPKPVELPVVPSQTVTTPEPAVLVLAKESAPMPVLTARSFIGPDLNSEEGMDAFVNTLSLGQARQLRNKLNDILKG